MLTHVKYCFNPLTLTVALWVHLSVTVPGCQKLQMTLWHGMLYGCTQMAAVGVKGLK